MCEDAAGRPLPDLAWRRALSARRLISVTAPNYRLHVTGRRTYETWELFAEAFSPMVEQGRRLLS
jgi:hypothetical protein